MRIETRRRLEQRSDDRWSDKSIEPLGSIMRCLGSSGGGSGERLQKRESAAGSRGPHAANCPLRLPERRQRQAALYYRPSTFEVRKHSLSFNPSLSSLFSLSIPIYLLLTHSLSFVPSEKFELITSCNELMFELQSVLGEHFTVVHRKLELVASGQSGYPQRSALFKYFNFFS